jgi:predicted nuclease of predicted toxin-antitoxin system
MNLTFVIDMNLSPAWVDRFAREGWTAVHWSAVGDARAADAVVMEHARAHGQVVFTHDLDFGAILANTKATGPSVIQVRAQDVTPESLGDLVVSVIRDQAQRLASGALITDAWLTEGHEVFWPVNVRAGESCGSSCSCRER